MATSISIRHYVGIYIYETYIYKMSASVPREDDTEIPWSPKGPIERNVINIIIYIYNKSPWESHSQEEQHTQCSLIKWGGENHVPPYKDLF